MPSVIQSPVLSPNSTQASIKLQSKGFINVCSLSGTLVFDGPFLSLSGSWVVRIMTVIGHSNSNVSSRYDPARHNQLRPDQSLDQKSQTGLVYLTLIVVAKWLGRDLRIEVGWELGSSHVYHQLDRSTQTHWVQKGGEMDTLCVPNWSHICSYIGHIFWYLEGESLGIGGERHLGNGHCWAKKTATFCLGVKSSCLRNVFW